MGLDSKPQLGSPSETVLPSTLALDLCQCQGPTPHKDLGSLKWPLLEDKGSFTTLTVVWAPKNK